MTPRTPDPFHLAIDLARREFRRAIGKLRRGVLARAAAQLSTDMLDDARIAATEELARRGLHVITHRPNRPKHQMRAQRRFGRH